MNWLDTVMERFTRRALTATRPPDEREVEIRNWLAQVRDDDPCLLAVREILAMKLLQSAAYAGSHASNDTLKLQSCERMECFRMLLLELEQRRADARAWVNEQRQPPPTT